MPLTDSHCHLDFSPLGDDTTSLSNTLQACLNADIKRLIVPAVSPDNWSSVLKLTQQDAASIKILTCLGIHPWYLNERDNKSLDGLGKVVAENFDIIVGIGETGIDGNIAERENNLAKQISFFEYHLSLAQQYQLPLIIHHYKAHQQVTQMLNKVKPEKAGIIHGFSGSFQQAKQYIDLGFKLGIGGTITYERAKKTINTVKKLPLDSIVIETDAPSMPLSGKQGLPNHPKYLTNIFNVLCSLRTEPKDLIAHQLEVNINTVFNA